MTSSLLSDIEGYTCSIESNLEKSLEVLQKSLAELTLAVGKLGDGVPKEKS